MKVASLAGIPVFTVLAIAAAGTACAQGVMISSFGGVGIGTAGPVSIKGASYSGTRTTTRVQTLADGTTVTHSSTQKESRDSEGRTYHAIQFEMSAVSDQPQITQYIVFDPVKRITMRWSSNGKIVTINHMPDLNTVHPTPPPTPQGTQPTAPVLPRVQRNTIPGIHMDDLGQQDINGVLAQGRRVTRTIPEGREGNDRPITTTSESWISPELHTDVLMINNDPRTGNSRTELSDIDRNEPDSSLFQAPDGYTVREVEPVQPQVEVTNPQ